MVDNNVPTAKTSAFQCMTIPVQGFAGQLLLL